MTAATELLAQARVAGIVLFPEDDGLRIRSPKGALTSDLRAALVACKPEILALLRAPSVHQAVRAPERRPAPVIVPPDGWRGPYRTAWGTVAYSAPGAAPIEWFGPPSPCRTESIGPQESTNHVDPHQKR